MPNIFISYRRQDTAIAVGRIYDRLVQFYGTDSVFMDIDTIPVGVDFREYIDNEVRKCDAMLVIMGEHWIEIIKAKNNDPKDFVRIEIEAALKRKIPVVPVFLGKDVRPPSEADLPSSISVLAYRNGIVLDPTEDFRAHMDRLRRSLDRVFTEQGLLDPPETRMGQVTHRYGDAIFGNEHRYDRDDYLGRASQGDKLKLLDRNVAINEFGFPIIKVRIMSGYREDVICWIKLDCTSFEDRYNSQSNTIE